MPIAIPPNKSSTVSCERPKSDRTRTPTSGVLYTTLYGRFGDQGHPEYVWYVLAAHMIVAIGVFVAFQKLAGEFKTHEE